MTTKVGASLDQSPELLQWKPIACNKKTVRHTNMQLSPMHAETAFERMQMLDLADRKQCL